MRYYGYYLMVPLCKEKKDQKMIEFRAAKMAFNLYRTIYFTIATYYGYVVMKDTIDLPPSLGGTGDINNWFVDYPYRETSIDVKTYQVFTMGYHVSNTILILCEKR